MAQVNNKFDIQVQASVNGATWTAVVNPTPEARRVSINNRDLAADLFISTDTSDVNATDLIAAGTQYDITLSDKYIKGFVRGETVCYLKGAGDKPIVRFEV